MDKLKSFVRLDFMTVKPYFTGKNLLIFAVVAMFLSTVSGTVQMSIGIGLMLGTLFISYPFAVGEKSNMDALYVTLSISRKTVVLGRYLFVLALNLCAVVGSFTCASFGLFAARLMSAFQGEVGGNNSLAPILALAALMLIIQIIQLPLFFKVSYTKAKFLSVVPFAAFMAGYTAFMGIAKSADSSLDGMYDLLAGITANGLAVPLAIVVLAAIIGVSYSLSVRFYRKRDF